MVTYTEGRPINVVNPQCWSAFCDPRVAGGA